MSRVLSADVGGTNTRIALCDGTRVLDGTVRKFSNDDFPGLGTVLETYCAEQAGPPCAAACVAVAGPVHNGVGRLTNRAWTMDAERLCAATGAMEGFVINDLEAQGHAIAHVGARWLLGAAPEGAPRTRLVVGVGTGFNAAPVHITRTGDHVAVSECGHISLPVWSDESFALSRAIAAEHGFASVEEVLSGRGLPYVWGHLAAAPGHGRSSADIMAAAKADPGGTEAAAIALMCETLGRVVGDLALIHLPFGGIFLIGGMARALSPWMTEPAFLRGYLDKGRFSDFLRDFPIAMVEDDFAALIGCADYVAQRIA